MRTLSRLALLVVAGITAFFSATLLPAFADEGDPSPSVLISRDCSGTTFVFSNLAVDIGAGISAQIRSGDSVVETVTTAGSKTIHRPDGTDAISYQVELYDPNLPEDPVIINKAFPATEGCEVPGAAEFSIDCNTLTVNISGLPAQGGNVVVVYMGTGQSGGPLGDPIEFVESSKTVTFTIDSSVTGERIFTAELTKAGGVEVDQTIGEETLVVGENCPTTPAPTTPTPTPSDPDQGGGGGLPKTGSDALAYMAGGLVALLAGVAALTYGARRRAARNGA